MGVRRNISLRSLPAPFLVMTGPDEEMAELEMRDFGLVPAGDLLELKKIFEAANDSRSHGGTVWAVYIWNRTRGECEFLDPEKAWGGEF